MPDTPEKPDSPEEETPSSGADGPDDSSRQEQPKTDSEQVKKDPPKKRQPRTRKKAPAKLDEAEAASQGEPGASEVTAEDKSIKDGTPPDTEPKAEEPKSAVPESGDANDKEQKTGPKDSGAEGPSSSGAAPVKSSGRGWMGIAALAVLLIVGGAAIWTYPWNGTAPIVDDNAAFNAIGNKLNELEARVQKLETAAPTGSADASDLTPLREKLAALESQVADLAAAPAPAPVDPESVSPDGSETDAPPTRLAAALDLLASLEARIDQLDTGDSETLQQRVQAMESLIAETDVAGRLDSLESDLSGAANQTQLSSLAGRVAALETGNDAEVMRAASLAMAVSNLSRAAAGSAPFKQELAVVRALAPDQSQLSALSGYADTGLPTIAALQSEFAAFGRAAIRADRVAGASGWWESLLANLSSIITVRNTNETEGETTSALISRIENHLVDGNLFDALNTADQLSPAAKEAMGPWLERAQPRGELEVAIENLNADVLAAIAANGSGD